MKIEDVTQAPRRSSVAERLESLSSRMPIATTSASSSASQAAPHQAVVSIARKPDGRAVANERLPQATKPTETQARADVNSLAQKLERQLRAMSDVKLTFEISIDEPPVIILRNSETGEEIRRIPPEDNNKLANALEDLKGLIVDRKS